MKENLNTNLSEVLSDAAFVVEWIDCRTGRFIQVNDYSADLHGMKKEDIEGMLLWDLDPDFSEERFFELVELMRVKKHMRIETLHRRADGTVFPVEVNTTYRGEEAGCPEHFIAVVKDITKRKDMEKALVQKNAELEELIYRVSHDVRAPLHSIKPLIDVMTSSLETEKYDVAVKAATHVATSVNRLEAFVEDLLHLARANQLEEAVEETNVGAMINDALKKLEYMDNMDRLEVRVKLGFSDLIAVRPSRLRMIIENLISNAVKYQDCAKDRSYVEILTHFDDGIFVLEVNDNGLGVPKGNQDELFHMFKRFHPKQSFGCGLGLYMIKKCADILGGELEFVDLGDGSSFRFILPVNA